MLKELKRSRTGVYTASWSQDVNGHDTKRPGRPAAGGRLQAHTDVAISGQDPGAALGAVAPSSLRRWMKKHLVPAAGLAVLTAVIVLLALTSGLTEAADTMIVGLREAGPVVFFAAMALLPAVGFPMIAFTLPAGPVFGPTLGPGWVIVWSLMAVVVNLLLTYWLANRALRPLVNRLLTYFEFRMPDFAAASAWQITLIVRLTPGPPFWVQSYLLGLIRVPLVPYLVVSTFVMAGYIVALVFGGDAIAEGNGRMVFVAIAILVVSVAVLQLLRKWLARRNAVAIAPGIHQPVSAR